MNACLLFALLSGACSHSAARPGRDRAAGNRLRVGGGTIDLDIHLQGLRVSRAAVARYVRAAARAVSNYYGRYPVAHVDVTVVSGGRGRDIHGLEVDGRYVRLNIGADATDGDLAHNWVATHEMFHLAFPRLDDRYNWMNEGLSDYLEPIARGRLGQLSAREVWRGFVEGMPQGLPQPGDRGLDNTHTWANTYWGGALYWLLADVRIREQTRNRRSLDDALRAILREGGDGAAHWPLARVLEVGDRATGATVLKDLHEQMGLRPYSPDLDALWKRLGIRYDGRHVSFDDRAPLAAIRKAITAPKGR